MALPCTKLLSGMVSASDMAGHLSGYHRYVSVVAHFLWTMRRHALPMAIQPCVTMRSQWGQGPIRILPEEGSSCCRSGTALAASCWWTVPSSLHAHGRICSLGCCCQRCLGRKVRAIVHGRSSFQPACSLQRQDVRTLHVQAAWGRKAAAVWGTCPWCWACLICAHCLLCGRGMWQSCCGLDEKNWFYVVWKKKWAFLSSRGQYAMPHLLRIAAVCSGESSGPQSSSSKITSWTVSRVSGRGMRTCSMRQLLCCFSCTSVQHYSVYR